MQMAYSLLSSLGAYFVKKKKNNSDILKFVRGCEAWGPVKQMKSS